MRGGVELTAYLVNESRARRGDLARDRMAQDWIPATERPAVRALWDDFAETVYPHDDLVVSLRGRFVLDTLSTSLVQHPDTVLVVCGAGFSSYPWLLPFPAALEVDLPDIISAKRQRAAHLAATGIVEERNVEYLALDLGTTGGRRELVERVRTLAGGRPVALVAEGLVFYLSPDAARATASLGAG
ncbi:MAG: class I SAM-dependent methyltransferase, partial [Pseudonocardiaceae bacterium]